MGSIAGPPQNIVETRPLPPPVIPHAAPYVAAIPPAPTNQGPAPADTVVQQKILAPVRTHTRITPQQTNIIPQINVQNYNVDVPVHVPVPVEREVIVNKHVPGLTRLPCPGLSPSLPLTRFALSRRLLRLPTFTTPPTTCTLPRLWSPLTPPLSTRLSMSLSTLSRPMSPTELPMSLPWLPTPLTPWLDTLPSPLLPESSELLTESSEELLLINDICHETYGCASLPTSTQHLFMFGNCSLFRRLIFPVWTTYPRAPSILDPGE